MAGLLGNGFDDPRSGAVMALAGGLLRGDMGGGLLGANDAYSQAQQNAMRKQLFDLQLQDHQMKLADAQRQRDFLSTLPDPMMAASQQALAGGGGPTLANASRVAVSPMASMLYQGVKAGAIPVETYIKSMAPQERINKLDVKDFTPESVQKFNQSGNFGDLIRMDKLHFADTGGAVQGLDPFTGRPVGSVPKTGNQFSDLLVAGPNGGLVPNQPLIAAKKDIAQAGAARTNVTVDAAPKAFWSDFGKSASDALFKERETAQAATSVLQGVGEIRKAAAAGAYQGAGAEMKLGAAKALNAMGAGFDSNTIANTEVFNANAKQFVLAQIKMLGANPSNADREFIEKTVPSLSTDPKALPRLLDFMEGKARQQVDSFNSKVRNVQGQPNARFMPFSLEVQAPPPTQATPQASMRFNPATGKLEQVR